MSHRERRIEGDVDAAHGRRRLLAAALPLLLLATAAQAPQPAAPDAGATVYRIPITGDVGMGTVPYVQRSLREAVAAHATAAVLFLDASGGRWDAAQQIADAIAAAPLPVYAYVEHRALGPAAVVAMAARAVYMDAGATMGASAGAGAGTGAMSGLSDKVIGELSSEMATLAEHHHVDPRIARAMVDPSIDVQGLVQPGRLLTLSVDDAAKVGYATPVSGWDGALAHVGLAGATVVATSPSWAERVVGFLALPAVAPLLLVLGFLGLLIEIKMPHFGVVGLIGAGLLALFFGSHYIVGLAGALDLVLLGIGLLLIALEAFVIPGFGITGIAGIGAVLASVYLSLLGHFPSSFDYTRAAGTVLATLLAVLFSAWALLRTIPRNRRLRESGVLLGESMQRATGYVAAPARGELVGAQGVAATDLHPAGVGEFAGERIDVVAQGGAYIAAGTPIEVVTAEGYRHVVRATEANA